MYYCVLGRKEIAAWRARGFPRGYMYPRHAAISSWPRIQYRIREALLFVLVHVQAVLNLVY